MVVGRDPPIKRGTRLPPFVDTQMNDTLKNKYVLGGLTLRDLREIVEEMRVYSLKIDWRIYERFEFTEDGLEIWETQERSYDGEPANRVIDLDIPVKIEDGGLVINDPNIGEEETIVFGKLDFTPSKIGRAHV